MQIFIFIINIADGEKEDQFNGSPPRPQPRGPRTPPGPPPPDDDEDEPMPVSGRTRLCFICCTNAYRSQNCVLMPIVRFPVFCFPAGQIPILGKEFERRSVGYLKLYQFKS